MAPRRNKSRHSGAFISERSALAGSPCGCDWTSAHLALVDGDGPGQFERQLLSAEVRPTAGLEHPALRLQHLCNAAQEPHPWESWGVNQYVEVVQGEGDNSL